MSATSVGGGATLESAPEPAPAKDALAPRAPEEARARKNPRAIAVVFLFELAWGFVVAAPAHAWAKRVWGSHPDGDAVLWAPGGRELLTWLGGLDPALSVVTRTSMLLLFVGVLLAQVPLAALLVSLGARRDDGRAPRMTDALARGVALFVPFTAVLALVSLVELLVLGIGAGVGALVERALTSGFGDALALDVRIAVTLFGLALALVVGVFGDLVRVALAYESLAEGPRRPAWTRLVSATKRAARVGRGGFLGAIGAWAWRAGVGLALVDAGAFVAGVLGGRGGAALVALWLVHQGVVLGRIGLRASFLASALRLQRSER